MAGFPHAPGALVVFGITCAALAGLIGLVLGWHAVRRALDIPRVPRGAGTYAVLVVAGVALLVAGVGSLLVADGLEDWPAAPLRAPVAEVRCHRLGPTTAAFSFVPLGPDGARGPEETENVEPAACALAFQRLQFAPALGRFGLVERHRLARVGARSRPTDTPAWRALPRPLGLPAAVASEQTLTVPPANDDRFRVVGDEHGFRLEKL